MLLTLKSSAEGNAKPIDTSVNRILIINAFDAMSVRIRKNKRELLRELTDSLKNYLSNEIWDQIHRKSLVIPDIKYETDRVDSLVNSLLEQNNATKAILITAADAYFEETGSRDVQEDGEKPKTVHLYDLCTKIKYTLYQKNENPAGHEVENCKYFTDRSTGGRFSISFGPDIVGKKKHTFGAFAANAAKYIDLISSELIGQ